MKRAKKPHHNIVAEIIHQIDFHFIPGGGPRGQDVITRESLMAVFEKYLIDGTAVEKRRKLPVRAPLTLEYDELRALSFLIDARFELYTIGPVERRKRIERLQRIRRKLTAI